MRTPNFLFPFLILTLLLASCTREEMENTINDMLIGEPYTTTDVGEIPQNAVLFFNGERSHMPVTELAKFPPDLIESISIHRKTDESQPGEVHIQLKEGVTMATNTVPVTSVRQITGSNLGEIILNVVSQQGDISEFEIQVNGKKAGFSDIRNYTPAMIASIQVNSKDKIVAITTNDQSNGAPAQIRTTLPTVRDMIQQTLRNNNIDPAKYFFCKNGEKSSLEEYATIPIDQVVRIDHRETDKIIDVILK